MTSSLLNGTAVLTGTAALALLFLTVATPAAHARDEGSDDSWYEGPSQLEMRNDWMRNNFNPTADPYRYQNCYDKERKRHVDCRTLRNDQYQRERELRRDCWDFSKEPAPYCNDIAGVGR